MLPDINYQKSPMRTANNSHRGPVLGLSGGLRLDRHLVRAAVLGPCQFTERGMGRFWHKRICAAPGEVPGSVARSAQGGDLIPSQQPFLQPALYDLLALAGKNHLLLTLQPAAPPAISMSATRRPPSQCTCHPGTPPRA